jgi:outer membrane receptor protein involved in Fe transport
MPPTHEGPGLARPFASLLCLSGGRGSCSLTPDPGPRVNFWFTLGASWNSTEINDPHLTVAPCGGGCTVLDPAGPGGTVYVDGNSLPNAPEIIFNGIINYQSDPVAKGFFGSLDWAYSSEKLELWGAVRNLLDEDYESEYAYPGPGRAFSVGLSAKL